MIKVTYLDHSGFLVELEDAYFLFDYYKVRQKIFCYRCRFLVTYINTLFAFKYFWLYTVS